MTRNRQSSVRTPISTGAVMAALLLSACTAKEGSQPPDTARTERVAVTANLVDSTQPLATAASEGWNFQQSTTADLDGDGKSERVVLIARVEMMRGRPLWDDGQPWQVYVESEDQKRTYMYARFVQLGTLTMRLSAADSGAARRIVLLEQLPDRLAVYEAEYRGVGQLAVTTAYEQMLDPAGDLASPTLP